MARKSLLGVANPVGVYFLHNEATAETYVGSGNLISRRSAHLGATARSQVVSIEGKEYPSMNAAGRELNMPVGTIRRRVRQDKAGNFKDWFVIDEPIKREE